MGCGGGDDGSGGGEGTRTTAFKSNDLREPGVSGTSDARACDVLPASFVARSVGARQLRPRNAPQRKAGQNRISDRMRVKTPVKY